jgi:hypothetical protein
MPGIDAPWITVPEKTLWEMYEQEDETCGGGIYWSRNRLDPSRKNWKSAITNWEYTDAAARVYFETKNQTVLDLSIKIHDWLFSSGLVSEDGTLGDGMYGGDAETLKCVVSPNQYSYNYGAALGTSAWLLYVLAAIDCSHRRSLQQSHRRSEIPRPGLDHPQERSRPFRPGQHRHGVVRSVRVLQPRPATLQGHLAAQHGLLLAHDEEQSGQAEHPGRHLGIPRQHDALLQRPWVPRDFQCC